MSEKFKENQNHGFGYLMSMIAKLSIQTSRPINIKDQSQVDKREELVKRLARLQKIRDEKKSNNI